MIRENRRRAVTCFLFLLLPMAGCGGFDLSSLIPPFLGPSRSDTTSSAFIAQGTYEARSQLLGGTCLVWVEQSGVVYHLFQGQNVSNADFDRITTPGTTSRLQIFIRGDIPVGCEQGNAVEVQQVLE